MGITGLLGARLADRGFEFASMARAATHLATSDYGVNLRAKPARYVPPRIPIGVLSGYKVAMLDDASKLPDDPAELKIVAVQLASTVKSQALRIAKLEHELAVHRRHRFGSKSETMDQLALLQPDTEHHAGCHAHCRVSA